MNCKDKKIVTIQVCLGENSKSERLGKRIGLGVERALNEFFQSKRDEGTPVADVLKELKGDIGD